MQNIDFNISEEYEEKEIGSIQYFNGQTSKYYSEESMLRAYKSKFDNEFLNGIQSYNISTKNGKTRHGLQYELIKEQYNELGLEYTKLDYMLNYVYCNDDKDNRDFDIELVR